MYSCLGLLGEDLKLLSAMQCVETAMGPHLVTYTFDNETGEATRFDNENIEFISKEEVTKFEENWNNFEFFVFERQSRRNFGENLVFNQYELFD